MAKSPENPLEVRSLVNTPQVGKLATDIGRMPDSAGDILPARKVSDKADGGTRAAAGGQKTADPKPAVSFINMAESAEENLEQLASPNAGNSFDIDFTGNKFKDLAWLAGQDNLAGQLTPSARAHWGAELIRMVGIDEQSRSDWEIAARKGLEMADVFTRRDMPDSVTGADGEETNEAPAPRYPLVTQAIIEFAARSYDGLMSDPQIVKATANVSEESHQAVPGPNGPEPAPANAPPIPPGASPAASPATRLNRLSDFLSYAVMVKDPNWQDDTDRLLHHLACCGLAWRKRWYNPDKGAHVSEFVTAFDVIVNNTVSNFEDVPRLTHRLMVYPHRVRQHVASGFYYDVDSSEVDHADTQKPMEFYEVHTWLDLDEDGIDEPWIVTIQKSSQRIVRLTTGFDTTGIEAREPRDGGIKDPVAFTQLKFFTPYHFVPSFDGSFHSQGFGHVVSRLNQTIDEIIAAIVTAAKRNNSNGGLVGRVGAGMPESIDIRPDELQVIPTDGADLASNVVMFQTREIPQTLFAVLGLLTDAGKNMTASVDLEGAPANMPATTAMAIVDQGMRLHSSIHRRVWRAMGHEFQQLFDMARKNTRTALTFAYQGSEGVVNPADFADIPNIAVGADPNLTTTMHRAAMAEYYRGFLGDPQTNQTVLRQRMHELMRIPEPEKLVTPPPQEPPPDIMAKLITAKAAELRAQNERDKLMISSLESEQKTRLLAAQAMEKVAVTMSLLLDIRRGVGIDATMGVVAPGMKKDAGGAPGEGATGQPPTEGGNAAGGQPATIDPVALARAENDLREVWDMMKLMFTSGAANGPFSSDTGTPVGTPESGGTGPAGMGGAPSEQSALGLAGSAAGAVL